MAFETVKANKIKPKKQTGTWCYGFCYGGTVGKSGFKPAGYGSYDEAAEYIRGKHPECEITLIESDGKLRGHKVVPGTTVPTGYIMFELPTESQPQKYMVVDLRVSVYGSKDDSAVVLARGTLDACKKKIVDAFGKGGKFTQAKGQYSYLPKGYTLPPDVAIVRC